MIYIFFITIIIIILSVYYNYNYSIELFSNVDKDNDCLIKEQGDDPCIILSPGPKGNSGHRGYSGNIGFRGPTGMCGQDGEDGNDGIGISPILFKKEDGSIIKLYKPNRLDNREPINVIIKSGDIGKIGKKGKIGEIGLPGKIGKDGLAGKCIDGINGLPGEKGEIGNKGPMGNRGKAGCSINNIELNNINKFSQNKLLSIYGKKLNIFSNIVNFEGSTNANNINIENKLILKGKNSKICITDNYIVDDNKCLDKSTLDILNINKGIHPFIKSDSKWILITKDEVSLDKSSEYPSSSYIIREII
tara:strand:+ start:1264 stop:2175 length:912 start_codon:yes stop_codon:yes gene_type:complete